jgi:hypothetical protein
MLENTPALHTAEIVHWAALIIMGLVYTMRLFWIFKFNAGKDRQRPGDFGTRGNGPALYSLANVAMPWAMESTRKGFGFYLSFVIFHLGVAAGIFLAIFNTLIPEVFTDPVGGRIMLAILSVSFLVSLGRVIRRFARPVLRLISSPDDYFSVMTITVWLFTGILAQALLLGYLQGTNIMVVFLYTTSFFLIYVPFSKISHYLYYPFIRWYLGKTLGHRGSMPVRKS